MEAVRECGEANESPARPAHDPLPVALVALRFDRREAVRSATRQSSLDTGPCTGLAGFSWQVAAHANCLVELNLRQ